jgi:lipopolysaccharide/colanic/teichoic acid biosynthesis glycosyltransferase
MNRLVEIIIAGLLIAFTLPLMAIVSLAIKIDSPGPVLSRSHPLRGKGSNGTHILKFRTTLYEPRTVGRSRRHTRVGRFLYLTRINQLPVLFNIVRGDLRLSEAKSLINTH